MTPGQWSKRAQGTSCGADLGSSQKAIFSAQHPAPWRSPRALNPSCSQKSPTHRYRPPFGSGAFSSFLHSSPWPLWSGPRFNTQPYGWWDERFIPGINTYRVLEGVGKGQSRREATGSEKAPASPFGQPSTKIGQPREGPLASCTSVRCLYRASGGTGLGTEQRRARSSGTSGSLCILSSTASDHSTFSDGDCHSCTFKVNV